MANGDSSLRRISVHLMPLVVRLQRNWKHYFYYKEITWKKIGILIRYFPPQQVKYAESVVAENIIKG